MNKDVRQQLEQFENSLTYYKFDANMNPNQNMTKSLSVSFTNCFAKHHIAPAERSDQSSVLFFKLLTDYIKLKNVVITPKHRPLFIFSILCIDKLASKSSMYSVLANASRSLTTNYTPKTYVLQNNDDVATLVNEYDENKLYILKKNVQRQQGCTITNNIEYIKRGGENNYVVCQELLRNVLTVNGHKINIRQYLLLVVNTTCSFYLFNDGFIYYTPKKYSPNSYDTERHITTGYIDRQIYEENPMTVKELYQHVGKKNANKLRRNLINMFGFVAMAYKPVVEESDSNQHTNFVILGCDVAIDKNFECKIMEINKGPDLNYKDEGRDKVLKQTLIENTLHQVGIINSPHNNFIQV